MHITKIQFTGLVETAEITMGRAAGVIIATYPIGEGIADALGAAVGPFFVLLDMVEGQWASAALCAVGLALGVVPELGLLIFERLHYFQVTKVQYASDESVVGSRPYFGI